MSAGCPTCGAGVAPEKLKTYKWDGKTGVYCISCDTPERRKADAPILEADDIELKRAVKQGWKGGKWRVYLEVGNTPGSITFPTRAIIKAHKGNLNPLEWRLEDEFNRRVDLEGSGKEIADEWLSSAEDHTTVNGTVSRGGLNE